MSTNAAALQTGEVVAGRYRIDALVGQGGFGVVFRATQLPIGRAVALKMLLLEALAHGDGRARFRREAELAQRLEHPNTVRLYDFGETETGLPFIAWEFLKGRPLDAVLATDGRLAPGRVARIAAQTLKALMEAHGLGIVHRDIKPSNIYLCDFSGESDFVKVLDFGIAKNTLVRGTGLTPEGSILGTPSYMAPEQVRGGEIAPPCDLYALGLVMAELLSGEPVFAGTVPLDVIMAQLADRPVPLPRAVVESSLGAVIARATQKKVDDRYGSAAEMLLALETAASALPLSSAEPKPAELAPTEAHPVFTTLAPAELAAFSPAATAFRPTALAVTANATMPRKPELPPTLHGDAALEQATRDAIRAESNADGASAAHAGAPAPREGPASAPALNAPAPTAEPKASVESARLAAPTVLAEPAPPKRSSLALPLAIGAVVVALACAAVGVLVLRRRPPTPAEPSTSTRPTAAPTVAPTAPPVAPLHHFASLTNKQIHTRIDLNGHRVVDERTNDNVTVFQLAVASHSVHVARMMDVRAAEQLEQLYLKQPGATARDGTCVIHVELTHPAGAHALLEHIIKG